MLPVTASGVATEKGFFCAVHPMGQENLPCPDWVERFRNAYQ
ncbi:hypothetical protein COO91_01932 [Nostoc flagelliforme CCNUN1]|uniref:Uncharacterized protein n=1 Tax=Nostoc flagelliforme CCNUN1 TaxID=2038116 RepID=A0A2K8SL63_9NOSO|nr:hypothetical protein COO91_01932 [Nostoc flagelliforme CCNUN1]